MQRGSLRLFSLLVLAFLWAVPTAQAEVLQLSYEWMEPDSAIVTVTLENDVSLGAVQIVLTFDPAVVTIDPLAITAVGRAADWTVVANVVDGELRIALIDLLGGSLAPGTGAIVEIPMQVAAIPAALSLAEEEEEESAVFEEETAEPVPVEEVVILDATVVGANEPPVIEAIEDQTMWEGGYSYQVVATDPDADALTYSLLFAPEGMAIDADGTIVWDAVEGSYAITVAVTDAAESSWESYTLTVERNDPPEIVSSTPEWESIARNVCAKLDDPWSVEFRVEVVDPEGDAVTYAWSIVGPEGEVSTEGADENSLTYTFEGVWPDQPATYTVSVAASDPLGESATRTWTATLGCEVPVPIELSQFVAEPSAEGVVLSWVTASETNNIGWNLYRSLTEDGAFVKVNEALIPGAGTSSKINVYEYLDRTATAASTYWYYLEQVDLDGTRSQSFRISTAPTDVAEAARQELPRVFALRNFPNPFNPATEIEYALPEERHVRLTVYNTLGQQVAVLVDAVRPAGLYRAAWRPENLQSGVFVYRLEAGTFVQAKKMTYLR
jgi:hypothetical protein